MSAFEPLVAKLREIFQIDRPDLDFGVYRILNARAAEIEYYLSNRLKARVAEALVAGAAASTETLKTAIAKAREAAEAAGYNPDEAPKVLSLQKELAAASAGASEHETQVFSHLLTFFSRYYDKGDFISQRRYKGDTYAIPYSGEEVVLHWANRDQYYTKSGESFSNFSFKLDDGRAVHFRLVAADTAKDNRKDNDKTRCFVLATARTVTRTDNDGETLQETIQPVAEEDGALVIRFDYAPQPKGTKQEALVDQAVTAILNHKAVKARWLALTTRQPTEKNPKRTLLEKHLTTFTQKNTADYFIHKDLGGFLRRELDFYIKNEVMNLDDVQGAKAFADIEKNLRMIQCLRAIALDLITFLASIENFQKKLWLKKKFVVAAQYCVTLDRVQQALYPAIAANPAQWAQWHDLGMRASAAAGTVEDLTAAPFLMVDTALFEAGFRADLLKAIPDLDASLDGLLVHGDNFQALTLLGERYRRRVDCIHVDPPYNSQTSGFLYKNSYQHSSWLSMMESRLDACFSLLSDEGHVQCHIDENEYESLRKLFDEMNFSAGGTIVWDKRNPMNGGQGLANQHEYIIWMSKAALPFQNRNQTVLEMMAKANELIQEVGSVTEAVRRQFSAWVNSNEALSGGEKAYRYMDDAGRIYQSVSLRAPEKREDAKFHMPLIHPVTGKACAMPPNGFSRTPETLAAMQARRDILFGADETTQPRQKSFLTEETSRQVSSMIQNAKKGKSDTDPLGLDFPYCHPVSLYEDTIGAATKTGGVVLDFFAGSGTTAHAVLNLNRDDLKPRRYLIVEVGDHFNTTINPRIQKIVYSADWKDGKPTTPETGISHAFKVLKIEGYEDTLNNLDLKRSDAQASLFDGFSADARDDYLMRYMLDVEAKGSLLSVSDFRKPFDYTLKVSVDSAGAWQERKVDLVETFNYLIGLTVRTIDIQLKQGFVTVEGWLPTGEKTLILWRDCDIIGYEDLTRLCDKLAINPADDEFDVVYINGDHNIPSVVETTEEDGSILKKLMLRQIEPAFLAAMFNADDV
ncbi:MAG: site-specific DNA-methyltransferase [Pseudomonadota bacterium]